MQTWTSGKGQCAFCLHRSIYNSTRAQFRISPELPRQAIRSLHRSRSLRSHLSRNTSIAFGNRQRDDTHRSNRQASRQPERPILESISSSESRRRLAQSLHHLKKGLENTEQTAKNERSQMQELDPEGYEWDRFEAAIDSLLKSSEGHEVGSDRNILSRQIAKAVKSSNWLDSTRRTLYFAFLDQILDRKHADYVPGRKQMVDMRYPSEWYTGARATQREIHLHVGPTNSGKTYNALKRLEEAGDGFYAGPLRLLAHEVYSRLRAKGISCDLVTGDDVRLDENENVRLSASTVEMVDVSRAVEVAVIDEIQMMAAEDRGWAWTRAFLGANAKEVHLCGEARVIPLIRELAASMGDTLHIHQYERLNPLKAMSRSLRGNLKNLRKGDCVVSFSIVGIHSLKKQIELDTGRRVAIVYGSLPPETRAQQANLFNDPDNDYDFLVASDAIGMGLNLSIKRIVFETVHKFNGIRREQLSISQIKQIAGRAGRFRTSNQDTAKQGSETIVISPSNNNSAGSTVGLVTCLEDADLPIIQEALQQEASPIKTAGLLPPVNFIEDYAARLPEGVPFEYIMQRLCKIAKVHPRFKLCNIEDQLAIAKAIEHVKGLTIAQRCMFAASPAHLNNSESVRALVGLAKCVALQKSVTVADVPEIPLEILEQPLSGDRLYLERLERLHKALILYLWLSYRFISNFKDRDMAVHAKELTEEKINTCLLEFSANPALRRRLFLIKQMSSGSKSFGLPGSTNESSQSSSSDEVAMDPTVLPLNWRHQTSNSDLPDLESSPQQPHAPA